MTPHYLNRLFAPRSIAVFGASDRRDSVGGRVFQNLVEGGFAGSIHAVNPKHDEVQGRRCHRSLATVGDAVDLAMVATPAATVPEVIHQCGEHGVRVAVVLSAGFDEGSGAGTDLLRQVLHEAGRHRMRIVGPNCVGVILPHLGVNATFSKGSALPGSLALVSQSGALCTSILDWAADHQVGFSAVVSLGGAADVDFGDLLDYLALDSATRSILLYVEGIRDARRFMSGLRVAARLKPVIVVKAGRHAVGSRAARSHSAALIGSDDAFDAALRRAGAVRAMTIEQLFSAAQLLAAHHRVRGKRLAIVSNGGGLGVMAADRAADLGVEVAGLARATLDRLEQNLPAEWSHANPVDLIGDAPPDRYRHAVAACLDDPGVDGVLVMLAPQAMTEPLAAARAVVEVVAAGNRSKPVLACWMGGPQTAAGRELLQKEGIPSFPNPEASVEAFAYLASYRENQKLLLQVPGPRAEGVAPDVEGARLIIDGALGERRDTLSTLEAKALLAAFRIPTVPTIEARSANDALVAAETVGFPVAMKVLSADITHKSDVGGVRLNVGSAHEVRGVYNDLLREVAAAQPRARVDGVTVEPMYRRPNGRELLIGAVRDPVFGPVVSFGAGGTAVELLRDAAVALPPLNGFISQRLIEGTRVARLLGQFRQLPPVRMQAIEEVLLRVSEMVCALPEIRELDINPLIADESGAVAVDVRVMVEMPSTTAGGYRHMAIHPYPSRLAVVWQLADGQEVQIRPIRPEDATIEQEFVRKLSPESKYFRFMQSLNELTPEMLIRFTQIDYDREMAFIAVTAADGGEVQLGVARYVTEADGESCEFGLVVADEWHGRGLGTRLMRHLMATARERGLKTMVGEVLTSNAEMLKLASHLGFAIRPQPEDATVQLVSRPL